MRTTRALVLGILAAAAWAAPAGAVWAGKPGGGGGTAPPGTIFFLSGSSVCSMDGNGANRTALTGLSLGQAGTYRASRRLHDGKRWFLHLEAVPGEAAPGGSGRTDLFAVREDGGVRVRLTSDPLTQYDYKCEWGADEDASGASIAVLGARWTGTSPTDTVVPGTVGLYTAHLTFDAGGTLVGLDTEPTLAVALPTLGNPGREFADVFMSFSWSPDTSQIAFNRSIPNPPEGRQIWIADLGSHAVMQIGIGNDPDWAPDGSKIAYCRFVAGSSPTKDATVIETIHPDGTGRTTVLSVKGRLTPSILQRISSARWSPNGSHIAYGLEQYVDQRYGPSFVYRVAADGSGATNLTPEGETPFPLKDWRW